MVKTLISVVTPPPVAGVQPPSLPVLKLIFNESLMDTDEKLTNWFATEAARTGAVIKITSSLDLGVRTLTFEIV
jgi:hypothetical protein